MSQPINQSRLQPTFVSNSLSLKILRDSSDDNTVITLGNNDYRAGISATSYTSTVVSFLSQLRATYPTQQIFLIYDFREYYNNADVEAQNQRATDKNLNHIDSYQWIDFTNSTVYQNGALTSKNQSFSWLY
jgi:hypothetical protein